MGCLQPAPQKPLISRGWLLMPNALCQNPAWILRQSSLLPTEGMGTSGRSGLLFSSPVLLFPSAHRGGTPAPHWQVVLSLHPLNDHNGGKQGLGLLSKMVTWAQLWINLRTTCKVNSNHGLCAVLNWTGINYNHFWREERIQLSLYCWEEGN